MLHLAKVNAILQDMGEGTIGERDAAAIFRYFDVTTFGDDAPTVEILDQPAEGFEGKIFLQMVRTASVSMGLMTSFLSLAS